MPLTLTSVTQTSSNSDGSAQVEVDFTVTGGFNFVQIYAVTGAQSPPGSQGAMIAAVVTMSQNKSSYSGDITVLAGLSYAIYACPRTGSETNPDQLINGQEWNSYCAMEPIVTKAGSQTPTLDPPVITSFVAVAPTIHAGGSITISWSAKTSYVKYLISWTQNGIQQPQHTKDEGEFRATSDSWTTPASSGAVYTFSVTGVTTDSNSDWVDSPPGPTVTIVAAQQRSLRQFLQIGTSATASLRSLIPPNETLKQFMQLS